jgi:hypothetical protein
LARHPSNRAPLTRQEIRDLDTALTAAFQSIADLRRRWPAARYVKFPTLPCVFSESILIACAEKLFGNGWTAEYGGTQCDVLIRHGTCGECRVEVKATGEHAFQELKAKDLRADVIVWIHFGRRFQQGTGKIVVWLLRNPARHVHGPCRLDIVRLKNRVGTTADLTVMEFESLDELLSDGS